MEDKSKNFDAKQLKFCPYEILNLKPPSSTLSLKSESDFLKQVNKHYRTLALKYHPDKHPNDKNKLQLFLWIKQA